MTQKRGRIALFETCLVRLFRPQVVDACRDLLQSESVELVVPSGQSCCGQPSFSGGDLGAARRAAQDVIELLQGYRAVVVPSGSCAATMVQGYCELLKHDAVWLKRARDLSARCFELSQYLSNQSYSNVVASGEGCSLVFHDACTGLRGLNIESEPRALIEAAGFELRELSDPRACCGFGGAFAVKYPQLSARIGRDKVSDIAGTDANLVTGPDLGCLLQLAGCLAESETPMRVYHLAEVLAGRWHEAGIGGSERDRA